MCCIYHQQALFAKFEGTNSMYYLLIAVRICPSMRVIRSDSLRFRPLGYVRRRKETEKYSLRLVNPRVVVISVLIDKC